MSKLTRSLAAPLISYFDPRFARIDRKLTRLNRRLNALALAQSEAAAAAAPPAAETAPALGTREEIELRQARLLGRVDVSEHNAGGRIPSFSRLECQAASARQCEDPEFLALADRLLDGSNELALGPYHRKLWEWAYIAKAVGDAGLLRPGATAAGFGVGREPLPAYLAAHGVTVLATDQGMDGGTSEGWAGTGQLMGGLASLSRPRLLPDADLAALVTARDMDMNAVPDDIGSFDITWSSCVIEHLGSPQRGLDFVLEACRMLKPGGIAVHTTELELAPQAETRDYGHCAVYRLADLTAFGERLAAEGFEADFNFYVAMETPRDRWISMAAQPEGAGAFPDVGGAHLKLALHDSVTTSFGLLVRRPA